ncbi:MAG TPA: hypothetical protein VF348_05180, partial [Usitatibacter sp.]
MIARLARPAAAAFALAVASASAQVAIEGPLGGWRNSAGEPAGFRQEVNYPASSVNARGQPASALIKGHIAAAVKGAPGTLVVNGVAMPLSTDERGYFERPYSFGAGSNGVEVRAAGGRERKRVQFFEANAGRPQAR